MHSRLSVYAIVTRVVRAFFVDTTPPNVNNDNPIIKIENRGRSMILQYDACMHDHHPADE